MRASEAWELLVEAMEMHRPACEGLDLFTADDLSPADVRACAAVCEPCPLFVECQQYRKVARPAAGVWAGKRSNGRGGNEDA
ncbi:hypothetical protein GCM10009792_13550 [Microcella alkalica]